MTPALKWSEVAAAFLAQYEAPTPLRDLVDRLRSVPLMEVVDPLAPTVAGSVRHDAGRFYLHGIRKAVEDHSLSPSEMQELRHLARLLRLSEGDLLVDHRGEVSELLAEELGRLLEDHSIDPNEALHKVKLQELLGLGYDQFLALTHPVIQNVVVALVRQLDREVTPESRQEAIQWLQRQVSALDTVFDLNGPSSPGHGPAGFIYLLVNPSMPGMVKIGKTNRDPPQRVAELTSATGVPTPFMLVFKLHVVNAGLAERLVHERLESLGHRVSENREFFHVTPSVAVEVMLEVNQALFSGSPVG